MKTDIHPPYDEATVKCARDNAFPPRATKRGEQHIELCNECHPFYTGKQKLVDAGGRVERFNKRYGSRKTKSPRPLRQTRPPPFGAAVAVFGPCLFWGLPKEASVRSLPVPL